MLEYLEIRNVALIDHIEVEFGEGLNILTGETGAGKSILIDSITFVLGGKTGRDFIRTGTDAASVSAMITLNSEVLRTRVRELGVDIDEDNALMLFRQITDTGKSTARVNGRTVTLRMLKDIAETLIDIHGQHEHQSLLNSAKHIDLLDAFGGASLEAEKTRLNDTLSAYRSLDKQLRELDIADREARMGILNFQIEEIERARLTPDEDTKLTERRKILQNAEKIRTGCVKAMESLNGDGGATDALNATLGHLQTLSRYADWASGLTEGLETALSLARDAADELDARFEELDSDPSELDRLEKRMDEIYLLRRKYGATVNDILEFLERAKTEYERLEGAESASASLRERKEKLDADMRAICANITDLRRAAATRITEGINAALFDLGMKKAAFAVDITTRESIASNGLDKVEFIFSANPGEPQKPLSRIASGGEMSRVMLAMKTILTDTEGIETYIFDEIDTGVSGQTAQKVAEKLAALSRRRQLLCITHLPQIAAMGDCHFRITKTELDGTAQTHIEKLEHDDLSEITRLMSGAHVTDAAERAAADMKSFADSFKAGILVEPTA